VSEAQVDQWIAEGSCVRGELRTIRLLKDGDINIDGTIYSDVYGKMMILHKEKAESLCNSASGLYGTRSVAWQTELVQVTQTAAAELIPDAAYYSRTSLPWRGDPRTLRPCPPPMPVWAAEANPNAQWARPRATVAPPSHYVLVRYALGNAPPGRIPGAVDWVVYRDARRMVLTGQGRFPPETIDRDLHYEDLKELAEARLPDRPPPGMFYMLEGTRIRYQTMPGMIDEKGVMP
jgi:hypothetical protein